MAPIDPTQILDAFTPLLTESGGIKPVDQSQFEKIYNIMKNCSTKLVSKCIYYQILMSTSPDVLEQFLKIGGWGLIFLWVKSSKDLGNVTFLLDLLKLLHILPMNIDRLRENNCPKIVKKLCKHENEEIALKANQIIKKWTKIIHALSEKNPGADGANGIVNNSNVTATSKSEKKRKTLDSNCSSSSSSSSSSLTTDINKKIKLTDHNEIDTNKTSTGNVTDNDNDNNNHIQSDLSDPYETYSRDEMNKFMINPQTKESMNSGALKKRPVTAKVKQGKFRLDLSVTTTTTSHKSNDKNNKKKNSKSNDSATKILMKNSNENSSKSLNSAKSSAGPTSNRNVLKDSMSFMDALSMMPMVGIKKRRKLNKDTEHNKVPVQSQESNNKQNLVISSDSNSENSLVGITNNSIHKNLISENITNNSNNTIELNNNNNNNNNNVINTDTKYATTNSSNIENRQKTSPPRFSFYKDILDEKCKENENISDSQENDKTIVDDECHSEHNIKADDQPVDGGGDGDESNVNDDSVSKCKSSEEVSSLDMTSKCDINSVTNFVASNNDTHKPKSILCYIKKNSKKNVRWPEDDSELEKIKYFELDETERINVTRPSADMKRFDMKHEAQMMSEAKKGRCFSYAPWKLIPIDLNPINVPVERGRDSREKQIQMERMKTTLECFYFHNQIPDNPEDPENCYEIMSDSNEKTRLIPLEDENALDRVQDYASIPNDPNNFSTNNLPFDVINYNNSGDSNSNYLAFNPTATNQNFTANSFPNINNANYLHAPSQQQPSSVSSTSSSNNAFDGSLPNNNSYAYNNFSNVSSSNTNQTPLPFTNSNPSGPTPNAPFHDFNSNAPNNYGPNSFNNNSNQSQSSPPNMFPPNQTSTSNYFNNPPPPMNQLPPPQNENYYWSETNNSSSNYPPGGGPPSYPPISPPPQQLGPVSGPGQRFRARGPAGGPRGSKGGGFYSRNGSEICRFFFKTGKCKFENRCNFSHVIDTNQKPSAVRFQKK